MPKVTLTIEASLWEGWQYAAAAHNAEKRAADPNAAEKTAAEYLAWIVERAGESYCTQKCAADAETVAAALRADPTKLAAAKSAAGVAK